MNGRLAFNPQYYWIPLPDKKTNIKEYWLTAVCIDCLFYNLIKHIWFSWSQTHHVYISGRFFSKRDHFITRINHKHFKRCLWQWRSYVIREDGPFKQLYQYLCRNLARYNWTPEQLRVFFYIISFPKTRWFHKKLPWAQNGWHFTGDSQARVMLLIRFLFTSEFGNKKTSHFGGHLKDSSL